MDFWPYVRSLLSYWWALMSCAVFTVLGVFVLAFNKSNQWALWATFGAAVTMLLLASFLAWRDQYRRAEEHLRMLKLGPSLNWNIQAVRDVTTDPETIQVSLLLFNSAPQPIRYEVEEINVELDGKAINNPKFSNRGGIIANGVAGAFYYPSFDAKLFDGKKRVEGKIETVIRYGNPDFGFTRKLSRGANVYIRLDNMSTSFLVAHESDVLIK
jgi:hypothetical protein